LITNSPAANSPFIVGLAGHADLEPAQFAPLVDSAVGFLRDLKQHLPDTDVRLMLEACGTVNLAMVRAALALDVSVDALIVAPVRSHTSPSGAHMLPDLRNHPRLQCIAVAAEDPSTPHDTPESLITDILVRRSSLLVALWDGRTSSAVDNTADTVFRFLGVHLERSDAVNRIEVDKVIDEMDLGTRLVYWVPVRRGDADASAHIRQPHYLLAAGDNVLDVQETMPSSLERRLADFNEYNVEFERIVADGGDARTGVPVKNILTFFSGFFAVLLGVWELRQNKMATRELLWQYRSQLSRFQRAKAQLQRITNRSRRDAMLKELGENCLMEIYLWAIHRYHREHAPPAAL